MNGSELYTRDRLIGTIGNDIKTCGEITGINQLYRKIFYTRRTDRLHLFQLVEVLDDIGSNQLYFRQRTFQLYLFAMTDCQTTTIRGKVKGCLPAKHIFIVGSTRIIAFQLDGSKIGGGVKTVDSSVAGNLGSKYKVPPCHHPIVTCMKFTFQCHFSCISFLTNQLTAELQALVEPVIGIYFHNITHLVLVHTGGTGREFRNIERHHIGTGQQDNFGMYGCRVYPIAFRQFVYAASSPQECRQQATDSHKQLFHRRPPFQSIR